MDTNLVILLGALALIVLLTIIGILSRYRRCKSDEILVIYGKTGGNRSSRCIQGGAAFIIPVLQGYAYMSLKPLQFDCNLQKALSSQNIRVDVPTTVTVGISTEPEVMQAAAERILGLGRQDIEDLVRDIVYGQMRTIIADMTIEKLNSDRDEFLAKAKGLIIPSCVKSAYILLISISQTYAMKRVTSSHSERKTRQRLSIRQMSKSLRPNATVKSKWLNS